MHKRHYNRIPAPYLLRPVCKSSRRCAMVSLTITATYMGAPTKHWPKNVKPQDLTSLIVNNIFKSGGAFAQNSYILFITKGAKLLGMEGKDTGVGKKLKATDIAEVDAGLKNGLLLAHVDYKKNWLGDHWILLTDKNSDGSYSGIDPTYGKRLKLFSTPDAGYKSVNHALLYGRSNSFDGTTPEAVKNYKVVRIVALK